MYINLSDIKGLFFCPSGASCYTLAAGSQQSKSLTNHTSQWESLVPYASPKHVLFKLLPTQNGPLNCSTRTNGFRPTSLPCSCRAPRSGELLPAPIPLGQPHRSWLEVENFSVAKLRGCASRFLWNLLHSLPCCPRDPALGSHPEAGQKERRSCNYCNTAGLQHPAPCVIPALRF